MDLILVSFAITVFVTGFYGGIWLCKTLMTFFRNTLGEEDDE